MVTQSSKSRSGLTSLESQQKQLHRLFFKNVFSYETSFEYWRIELDEVIELTCRMSVAWTPESPRRPGSGDVPAGLTYLSQMIAHDIVPNTNELDARFVSPYLNLDSLYPSAINTELGQKIIAPCGKFRLNSVNSQENKEILDFCRSYCAKDKTAIAHIVEPRNDENIILSAIVIEWMALHNRVIYHLERQGVGMPRRYDLAKEFVVRAFQKCIVDELLRVVLDENIYKYYFDDVLEPKDFLFWSAECSPISSGLEIPMEFSHAAFRFGHSMVRQNYDLNKSAMSLDVSSIFRRNQIARTFVDLRKFFILEGDEREVPLVGASFISLIMAGGLSEVPVDLKRGEITEQGSDFERSEFEIRVQKCESYYRSKDKKNTSEKQRRRSGFMNLIGADLRASEQLPTGGEIIDAIKDNDELKRLCVSRFQIDFEQYDKLFYDIPIYEKVKVKGGPDVKNKVPMNLHNSPLMLFLLLEAQQYPSSLEYNRRPQKSLGPIGSLIVAEVLFQSISLSDCSYLDIYKDDFSEANNPLKKAYDSVFFQKSHLNLLSLRSISF